MEFIPGPMELVIILIIVTMLFGVGRLPEVFGAVGKGLREFRREMAPTGEPAKMIAQQPAEKAVTENGAVGEAPAPAAVSQDADQTATQDSRV